MTTFNRPPGNPPEHVRRELQRLLDSIARRLLEEELANAHRVIDPTTTAIHPVVNHDARCADCEQSIPMDDEYVLTFKAELRPYRRGGARYCLPCAQKRGLMRVGPRPQHDEGPGNRPGRKVTP